MAGRSVINVLVNADTKDFVSGMDTASRKVGKFTTNSVKNLAKIGAAFTAAGAAAGVAFAKIAFDAAEAASTANARIEQIATSMDLFGENVDGVTDRLVALSEETARLTGVNQNTIKEAQALLLTFGNIADSADEAGGSFDRATMAALDLSAAGFGGTTDAAKQLGKALNDPITGISALARSGVTFTEQEKELIKTLVESGNQLEAQDMILSAIEKQVGGTAEATANASDKIRVGFSQISERVGLALLPAFEELTGFVLDTVIPGIESLVAVFEQDGLRGVIDVLIGYVQSEGPKVLDALWQWVQSAGEWIVDTGLPWLGEKALELGAALIDWIGPKVEPTLKLLLEWLEKLGSWFIDDALPWLGDKAVELGAALVDWIGPRIGPTLKQLGEWIAAAAQWFIDDGLPMLVDKTIELGNALVDWIKPRIVPLLEELGKLLIEIGDWILTEAVPKIAEEAAKLGVALIGWVIDVAPEIIKGLGTALADLGVWFVTDAVPTVAGFGLSLGSALINAILEGLSKVGAGALNIGRTIVNGIIGFINTSVIDNFNDLVEFHVPLPFGMGFDVNPPDIPNIPKIGGGAVEGFVALANGGIVTSPTLALIGEAGPEAVVPLSGPNAGGFGGVNVVVNAGIGTDGTQVGRQIVQVLNEYSASGGARLSSSLVGG